MRQNESEDDAHGIEPRDDDSVLVVERRDDAEQDGLDEIDGLPDQSPLGTLGTPDALGPPDAFDQPEPGPGQAALTDAQRWRELLADFVDDPRGAVRAATEMVEGDVSAFVALIDQRRMSIVDGLPGGGGTQTDELGTRTEQLRLVLLACRDFSRQLAASIPRSGR